MCVGMYVCGHVCVCLCVCAPRFLKFKKQPLSKRWLCCTCGLLLLEGEVKQHGEQGHEIKHRILHAALRRPTTLFTPHEDNKTFAVCGCESLLVCL